MKLQGILFPILISSLILFAIASDASASGVTRILPQTARPGENITVSIKVELTGGERYYLVEEIPPQGFEAFNPDNKGGIDSSGHVKWASIMNPQSTTLTYRLSIPEDTEPGTYSFSGQYGMEGIDGLADIGGQSEITVVSGEADYTPGIFAAIVIMVIAVIVALVLKRKK